jgi:NNP family nitrate/nitrite transporter-like MFS transporter
VALTVPSRIFIGMALDRFGPRRTYAAILMFAVIPCTAFALSQTFTQMVVSRLLLGIVGAGFVVGIRMVSEWFPPKELGTAEGVYGGWGNFGAAAAALVLPLVAAVAGGDNGWRWAIGLSGAVAAGYGLFYSRAVTDTPEGVTYVKPRRQGALEVTSRSGVFGLAALTVPVFGILGVIVWRIWLVNVIGTSGLVIGLVAVAILLATQVAAVFRVNKPALRGEYAPEDQYPLKSVAALCLAYFCTFGSELAVVTMLPAFFSDTWGLGTEAAGFAAGSFAFMNIVTRPGGGLLSDLLGSRRRTLIMMLGGVSIGFVLMSTMGAGWPVALAILASMFCSVFCQAGNGAVYAIVPLVKKRVSGQISGLAGAYGNVGSIIFLSAFLYVSPTVFFLIIAGASVVSTVISSFWLREPAASFATELMTDDTATDADETPTVAPIDLLDPALLPVPVPVAGA